MNAIDFVRQNAQERAAARHTALIDAVTDKIFGTPERPRPASAAERAQYDAAILPHLDTLERDARRRFAERIAQLDAPPPRVLMAMATDELPVAGIVLADCAALAPDTLAELCEILPPAHLAVIAQRRDLAPAMTTLIAARGSADARAALAQNTDIALSEAALLMLADAAERDLVLYKRLTARDDLAAAIRARILPMVALLSLRLPTGELAQRVRGGTMALEDAILALTRADLAFGTVRLLREATDAPLADLVAAVCDRDGATRPALEHAALSAAARGAIAEMQQRRHAEIAVL